MPWEFPFGPDSLCSVRPQAMPTAERRAILANVRITPTERAYLQQAASSRSTSVSALMREGLRQVGGLPAKA